MASYLHTVLTITGIADRTQTKMGDAEKSIQLKIPFGENRDGHHVRHGEKRTPAKWQRHCHVGFRQYLQCLPLLRVICASQPEALCYYYIICPYPCRY